MRIPLQPSVQRHRAYALAYNIASLLNNLFGKGKEPFWQQAYTNLVKFIIQLHKIAYGYVTLFDVYECAINPELLEKKIHEAEQLLTAAIISQCPTRYSALTRNLNGSTLWPMRTPGTIKPYSPSLSKRCSRPETLTMNARWKLHQA